MLFLSLVFLLGGSVILGYSPHDRRSHVVSRQTDNFGNVSVQTAPLPNIVGDYLPKHGYNGQKPGDDDGHNHEGNGNYPNDGSHGEEHNNEDKYDNQEGGKICLGFKDVVLKNLVGFPNTDGISDESNVKLNFMPVIMKGVSTFQLTYDSEMASKQMVIGFIGELLTVTEHCPSTVFTRILLYAAGKSFSRVILQEKDTFDKILYLMRKYGNVPPKNVRYFGHLMFGSITMGVAEDVASRLFTGFHQYLKMVFPKIQYMLTQGKNATWIDSALRNARDKVGLTVHCMNAASLGELYQSVWHDLETRFANDNYADVLDILPLSDLPQHVQEQIREKSKTLLRVGVQIMKRILSGLREERLGQLENPIQRLLSETELEALKIVGEKLHWKDKSVTLLPKDVISIVAKEEIKDLYALNGLAKMANQILMNPVTVVNEDLSASLKLLSAKLNDLIRRKCDTYEKYLGQYLSPGFDCKLITNISGQ